MQVTVNGEAREVPQGASVAELLREVEAPTEGVAVEVNRRIVRKADLAATRLAEGDRVEVVSLVGGG